MRQQSPPPARRANDTQTPTEPAFAGILGLVLGLVFDRRGITLGPVLLAVLAAIPMAAVGFLLSRGG